MTAVAAGITGAATLGASALGGKGQAKAGQAQAAASKYQADLAYKSSKEQIAEQQRQQLLRKQAYDEAISRGGGQMGEGETALMGSLSEANPELATQEADLLQGNAKALQDTTGQIHTNLAAQGVRGGQAATLEGRAVGDMGTAVQKDINQLKFQDAETRAGLLRAYQAAKAQRGQAATVPGVSF